MNYRGISRIVPSLSTLEGDGVSIRRAFPTGSLDDLDPFLLLDHLGPTDLRPGEAKGFPDHPHRGFETVTYLLEGQFQHRDSRGNHGLLGPGDLQWMTAGSGLVHSEMPGPDLIRDGGRLQGFQLWVNLPRRDKMIDPRYQELTGGRIPAVRNGGATVRIIAGEASGEKGSIETRIPIVYLHLTLEPGAEHAQSIPRKQNAFAYVIDGAASFGDSPASEGDVVIFSNDGDVVRTWNAASAKQEANVLLISGEPLNEPVARYGPFVMNTRQEVVQAFEDYRQGRLGRIQQPAVPR
jgi:redox-sensitive bicupin YhaK (pirin superfamily)